MVNVYSCPLCSAGQFLDVQGITVGKNATTLVQCDTCGGHFDINDPRVIRKQIPWVVKQTTSLDAAVATDEEGGQASLVDTLPGVDTTEIPVSNDVLEVLLYGREGQPSVIEQVAARLNIQGAEHAKEIFIERFVNGMSYTEITEKYLNYTLHFTECLDCGYTEKELPNPNSAELKWYSKGMPIKMRHCPQLNHEAHKAPSSTKDSSDSEDFVFEDEEGDYISVTQVTSPSAEIDMEEFKRQNGLNIVYHGAPPTNSNVPGTSYLLQFDSNGKLVGSTPLDPSDPRSYKGQNGKITNYIFQPAARLIDSILKELARHPVVKQTFQDEIEYLNRWNLLHLEDESGREDLI